MISIQQIQYIIALSEELHFQKAADKCYVTQPTLSMQIKKAEEDEDLKDEFGNIRLNRDEI